jgi:hypothetical protein
MLLMEIIVSLDRNEMHALASRLSAPKTYGAFCRIRLGRQPAHMATDSADDAAQSGQRAHADHVIEDTRGTSWSA